MAMEINRNYSNYAGSYANAVNSKKQTAEGVDLEYNMYSAAITKAESDKTFKMGTATREATGNGDGKNIGVMAIGNQVYLAQYSENSTPAKPIVKVGDYEVSVNDVDPENATEIEMFALMSHLDKTGQSQNEGMSSFSKMRTYSQQAESNGFCSGIADADEAWNSKRNWTEIIENARKTYSQSLIPEIYALTRKCDSLLDVMQKWIENRDFSNIGIS